MLCFKKFSVLCVAFYGSLVFSDHQAEITPQMEINKVYELHAKISLIKECLRKNTNNSEEVLSVFERLSERLEQEYLFNKAYTSEEIESIYRAIEFATLKHKGQFRKNARKTPYVIHPMGVAFQLLDIAKVTDPTIIKAALLHDILEDTSTTKEEITDLFGRDVLSIVLEVTDGKNLSSKKRKLKQVEHAPFFSKEAALVKTSDRLYNLRDCKTSNWSETKKSEYFLWGKRLYENLPRVSQELSRALESEIQSFFQEG